MLRVLRFLVYDGEDNDEGGCDDGPEEKTDFPPELPCLRTAAMGRLAGKECIFFCEVALVIRRGSVGEEGPFARHGDGGENQAFSVYVSED